MDKEQKLFNLNHAREINLIKGIVIAIVFIAVMAWAGTGTFPY
jgi:hypothetical protein